MERRPSINKDAQLGTDDIRRREADGKRDGEEQLASTSALQPPSTQRQVVGVKKKNTSEDVVDKGETVKESGSNGKGDRSEDDDTPNDDGDAEVAAQHEGEVMPATMSASVILTNLPRDAKAALQEEVQALNQGKGILSPFTFA